MRCVYLECVNVLNMIISYVRRYNTRPSDKQYKYMHAVGINYYYYI